MGEKIGKYGAPIRKIHLYSALATFDLTMIEFSVKTGSRALISRLLTWIFSIKFQACGKDLTCQAPRLGLE